MNRRGFFSTLLGGFVGARLAPLAKHLPVWAFQDRGIYRITPLTLDLDRMRDEKIRERARIMREWNRIDFL